MPQYSSEQTSLLEKVILGEVEGKNLAIHGYDNIIWKVRTGFLTLMLGGWAILLTGIVDRNNFPLSDYRSLAGGLLLFSIGIAFGAWHVDCNYVRRKFRVISALGQLTEKIHDCKGDYQKIPADLLKVSGDNVDIPLASSGHLEARMAGIIVYLSPLVMLTVAIVLIFK